MPNKIRQKLRNLSCHLGLGGGPFANLYTYLPEEQAVDTIRTAYENGIRYFDTAPLYGYGDSETRLGLALKEFPRDTYLLSTKVGRILIAADPDRPNNPFPGSPAKTDQFDYSYDGIMKSYQESLVRLGGIKPDIIFIHDLGQLTHGANAQTMLTSFLKSGKAAIEELRAQGIAIGLGVNEIAVCFELMKIVKLDIILLAGRYTLLDQTALTNGLLTECQQQDIAYIAAAPFNSGILTNDPLNQRFDYTTAEREVIERKKAIEALCQDYQTNLLRPVLQFPCLHSQVDLVLAGMRTANEVKENIENYQQKAPQAFWEALMVRQLVAAGSLLSAAESNQSAQTKLTL